MALRCADNDDVGFIAIKHQFVACEPVLKVGSAAFQSTNGKWVGQPDVELRVVGIRVVLYAVCIDDAS